MKHLKPFNESESYSLEDVVSSIREMALDFVDDGFNVVVKSRTINPRSSRNYSTIDIKSPSGTPYKVISDNKISITIDSKLFSDFTISGEKIIEFSERIESYLGTQNLIYNINYHWHDSNGHFYEKKPVWKKEKLRNIWIEIYMGK